MEILLIISGAIILLCIIIGFVSNYFFSVKNYHVISKDLYRITKGQKIVVISDLHNNSFGKDNSKLIDAIYNINPKFIIVAGDVLNKKSKDNNKVAKDFIRTISADFKIIYADGNHEQGFFNDSEIGLDAFNEEKFYSFFSRENGKEADIKHLANEYIDIENVRIYGLQISRDYYKRIGRPDFNEEYMKKLVGDTDSTKYNILIAHNPMYFEEYARWGADLVISGHLHGGMVRLPFIGGVISPQLVLFPKYSGGMYKYKNSTMILSKGLGTHTIKFRLFNIPEVAVISTSFK